MFRLWIGRDGKSLQRGPIYPTLGEALANGERLSADYAVKIETSDGSWHVFAGDQTTIGPRLAVGTAQPGEPLCVESLSPPQLPERPERRRARRKSTPLPELYTRSVMWNRKPATLVDMSWSGARVETAEPLPHAGAIAAIVVRAFGLTAQLAGRVRWARNHQFGVAFDDTLMTRSSSTLLARALGERDDD